MQQSKDLGRPAHAGFGVTACNCGQPVRCINGCRRDLGPNDDVQRDRLLNSAVATFERIVNGSEHEIAFIIGF